MWNVVGERESRSRSPEKFDNPGSAHVSGMTTLAIGQLWFLDFLFLYMFHEFDIRLSISEIKQKGSTRPVNKSSCDQLTARGRSGDIST